jgi:transposase-like protein
VRIYCPFCGSDDVEYPVFEFGEFICRRCGARWFIEIGRNPAK